jgi:hypothetical protein
MKALALVLFSAVLVAAAARPTPAAPPGVADPLVLGFSGLPRSLPPTPACPAGTVLVSGLSVPGGVPADAQLCIQVERPLIAARGRGHANRDHAPATTLIESQATIQVAGVPGELHAVVLIRQVVQVGMAQRFIEGRILGGTGAFAGATGPVQGGGTIVFGSGPPQVSLTLTFDFD